MLQIDTTFVIPHTTFLTQHATFMDECTITKGYKQKPSLVGVVPKIRDRIKSTSNALSSSFAPKNKKKKQKKVH